MFTDAQLDLLKKRSLLAVIFEASEIEGAIAACEVRAYRAGDIVLREGETTSSLLIPISGEVELFSILSTEELFAGVVVPGRSINTYAVLRNRPYQYSARFKTDGQLISLPMSILEAQFKKRSQLRAYLQAMTENSDLRAIAKAIDSYGCSLAFKLDFIARLQIRKCEPQEWLTQPGEVIEHAFYLTEGQIVTQNLNSSNGNGNGDGNNHGVQLWQVPARTWVGWKNLVANEPSRHIFKTISNATVLVLSKSNFDHLSKTFSEDVVKMVDVSKSSFDSSIEENDTSGEFDIDELIRDTAKPRRFFWQSYPWIRQSDQMDCAPACLAMISAYYDHRVSIQFWRSHLSTARDGTSLFDLALTSERCGFTSYALEVEDLRKLDNGFFPAIVLRKSHYMVVYKVTSKWIYLGDPSLGIRKMSHEVFADGFENALLFLRPNDKFFNLPETQGRYSHYFSFLKGLEKEITLNFAVSLMLVGLGLFTPILSQVFMDDILVRRDTDLLKIALGACALIAVLSGFLSWARVYYANYLATKFDFRAHSVFMKKMLALPYKFFADRHVGDFTQRLQEMHKVKRFLLNSVEKAILSILSLVVYATALLIYSPRIAIAVFCATPIFFLISWLGGKRLSTLYQTIFKEGSELESNLTDTIKGISTIKAQGAELACRWRYEEKFIALLKAERSFTLTDSMIGVFAGFYSQAVNFALMGFAAYLSIRGELSPGQVVAVTMIAGNVMGPFAELASQFGEIQQIKSVFGRLDDILLAPIEKASGKGRVKKDSLLGDIEFKDVWFRYGGEGSDWVLKGTSFKIEPGQHVAFVGPSGSGKSTIAALLTRMFEPSKGQIFIDGRDYLDYDIEWLRSKLGILHQENHLFQGSILENIAYSEPEVDLSKVLAAARRAAADEFIAKKPGQLAYVIAPGGLGLSGGEKQRIALARTFYRKPQVLILDEATSALDGIAEHKLLQHMTTSGEKLTVINIAHRYSTVKHSDFALVLFEGKVAGFGTHEDLQAENEIYRQLFSPQIEMKANGLLRKVS